LWDDPLFNSEIEINLESLTDPELLRLRRVARLLALETLYIELHNMKERVSRLEKAKARETWTIRQLLPHVPPEAVEQILIDRQVNEIDPDFKF